MVVTVVDVFMTIAFMIVKVVVVVVAQISVVMNIVVMYIVVVVVMCLGNVDDGCLCYVDGWCQFMGA